MKRSGSLIVLSGPSGVGKSSLVKLARAALPDLEFSVSATTRPPRAGEVDGREYHFLTPAAFEERFRAGEFLETADIFAHRYGTLKSEVMARLRRGAQVLLDIDVQGERSVKAAAGLDPELARAAAFVLIVPPSLPALAARLRDRNSETPEQLALRLGAAERELSHFREYDFIVVNDDLTTAAAELTAIFRAVRLRTGMIEGGLFA